MFPSSFFFSKAVSVTMLFQKRSWALIIETTSLSLNVMWLQPRVVVLLSGHRLRIFSSQPNSAEPFHNKKDTISDSLQLCIFFHLCQTAYGYNAAYYCVLGALLVPQKKGMMNLALVSFKNLCHIWTKFPMFVLWAICHHRHPVNSLTSYIPCK
ncbi:hypothetical protein BGX38DRAFT_322064 [Terfezia claveryi]|nr:hypothetical protein BGX38DRAFT_322064 [Terfezia claveryi]